VRARKKSFQPLWAVKEADCKRSSGACKKRKKKKRRWVKKESNPRQKEGGCCIHLVKEGEVVSKGDFKADTGVIEKGLF